MEMGETGWGTGDKRPLRQPPGREREPGSHCCVFSAPERHPQRHFGEEENASLRGSLRSPDPAMHPVLGNPGPGDPCGAELVSSTKASGPWWGLDLPPIPQGGARSLTRAGAGERRVIYPLTWLHSDGDSNPPSGPAGQTRWFGAASRFPHPCVLLLLLLLLLPENPPNANVM